MRSGRDDLIGRLILGRYRIVRRLARGGMGIVYLARSEGAAGFVKPVVVKRILEDLTYDDSMARMFVREARILSNLHHSGIVGVTDFGQEDGAYIMVLEYVHGYHLGRWNRYQREMGRKFPVQHALQVMIHVLDALHYAHTRTRPDGKPLGIVHRDISPSNVLVEVDGNVKLLDFGIARMSGDTAEYKTQDLTLKGKLAYLGPELFHGGQPTVQSDIYSCGIVLHELLVGKNEFRGKEMSETVTRVLSHKPTSVHAVRDDGPEGIDEVILKALAKKLDERWLSAADMAQALRQLRGIPEDQADAELSAAVRHDFLGDMPEKIHVEPLEALELAWRDPPESPEKQESPLPPSASQSDRPTAVQPEVARIPLQVAVPAHAPSKVRSLVGVGLIVAAVVAAGVLALSQRGSGPAPQVVVVQQPSASGGGEAAVDQPQPSSQDVAPSAGTAQAGAGSDQPAEAGDAGAHAGARPAHGVRHPHDHEERGGAVSLSRAFARQQGRIQACFLQHAADITGNPVISIRFQIDVAGHVQTADLAPAGLSHTALGTCLVAVARATEFGSQPGPAAFRIPITAHRTAH